jgi:membrane protein implicated in regulation of membrane protease activity
VSEPSSDAQTPEPDSPAPMVGDSWASRHPVAAYSLGRLVLFVVPFAILYFVADFFTALLIAFLISAIASIFLLRKQREALSTSIATRADRANQKMADRTAVEDQWDDAQRGDGDGSGSHAH